MKIIYIIEDNNSGYNGWLRIGSIKGHRSLGKLPVNNDPLRKIAKAGIDRYMRPAGQSYYLNWAGTTNCSISTVYHDLVGAGIPRYAKSGWFNTDVWTVRQILVNQLTARGKINGKLIYNPRRLKSVDFAKYLYDKYQRELGILLKRPDNSREQRFKRDFYNAWRLTSLDPKQIQKAIKVFAAYLLLRNLVNSVPNGCRKMFRKLVPLRIDDLDFDLKLLDYKCRINKIVNLKTWINSRPGKPFGTVEFTNPYLVHHVKFLRIFGHRFIKRYFNL